MRYFGVVCVFIVVFCVYESEGFKFLKKLKDALQPQESSTTIQPTLPAYESQHNHEGRDWGSWGQDSATSKTKSKHSDEDSSSQSSEHEGGSFSNNHNTDHKSKNHNQYDYHNKELYTTTYRYEKVNSENYAGQSSFLDDYGNQKVKSTTPSSYDFGSQNEREQSSTAIGNPKYDQSSLGGDNQNQFLLETTTKTFEGSQDQNNDNQSSVVTVEDSQSTTPRSYGLNENDKPEQSPSFGGTSESFDQLSATPNNFDSQNQRHDFPSSVIGNDGQNTQEVPEQSSTSYEKFNSGKQKNPSTNYNTQNNIVYTPGTYLPTSTSSGGDSTSTLQGENERTKYAKPDKKDGLNQYQPLDTDNTGGIIIFPDHPSLNPTPESESLFGENDPYLKEIKGKLLKTPAPVAVDDGRHIIDAPEKECGPGQTLDRKKNICKVLASGEAKISNDPNLITTPAPADGYEKKCGPGQTLDRKENICKELAKYILEISSGISGRRIINGPVPTCEPGMIYNPRDKKCHILARK